MQLHETVFAVIFRMVRPYLFVLQMGQLPLIYLGRQLKNTYVASALFTYGAQPAVVLQQSPSIMLYSMRVHACRRAGNFFFWFGLILGVPLLATVYCREYYYALSLKDNPHIMLGNV